MDRVTISRAAAAALLLTSFAAFGRDDVVSFPVADVVDSPEYASRLEGVKFYFGDQPHPTVAHSYGEYQSNKKTNAFNKSDKEACEWAFLSALLSFHERALGSGGDAVIDIKGYYKKTPFSSPTEFQCGVGNTVAGVTLTGTVVKLGEAAKPAPSQASTGKPTGAAPAAATHAPGGTDKYTELIKLDELRKKGILTEEEFQAEKKRILSQK